MAASRTLPRAFHVGWIALASVLVLAGPVAGEFVWDDVSLIQNNPYLARPDGWRRALTTDFWSAKAAVSGDASGDHRMYRPLVSLAYWAEFQAWGASSLGFHLVNLLLHALCVVLVYRWLCRRLRLTDEARIPASLGALLFAVHPSRAESVAWISGAPDVWMLLFILVGLEFWDRATSLLGTVPALIAFALAFFCKEVAIVVPALLLADALLGPADDRRLKSTRAIAVGAGMAAVLAVRMVIFPLAGVGVPFAGLATRVLSTFGGFVRLAIAPWPITTQLGYLASSTEGAGPQYPTSGVPLGLITVLGFAALAVTAWRTPAARGWLSDALWFVVFLLPVLNIVPFNGTYYVTARYLYAPGLGLAALMARGTVFASLLPPARKRLAIGLGAALLAASAVLTVRTANLFVSSEALWSHEHRRDSSNHIAVWNLMQVRMQQRRWDDAQSLAREWMQLQARSEDKAHAFGVWLSIEVDRAINADDARWASLFDTYERVASGVLPAAPDDQVAQSVPGEGLKWLSTSSAFQMRRAQVALITGHYDLARQVLEALAERPLSRASSRMPLVLALVAQGELGEANRRLDEAAAQGIPVDVPRLKGLVGRVGQLQSQMLPPAAYLSNLAQAFFAVGDAALARSLLLKASSMEPASNDLLRTRLQLELNARYFDHAARTLEQLRKSQPADEAMWKQVDAALQEAAEVATIR
jgi:tetratricopeptide (TPR) repeat protein